MGCHTLWTLIIAPSTGHYITAQYNHGVIAHNAGIYDAVIIFLKINIVEVAKTGQLPDNERGVNINFRGDKLIKCHKSTDEMTRVT